MSRYNEDNPPQGYGRSGFQQCDTRCIICLKRMPMHIVVPDNPGINHIVEFLEQNKAVTVCDICYGKTGFKLGKIPTNERT